MNIKRIFAICFVLALITMPAVMAATGEDGVTIKKADGSNTTDGITKNDDDDSKTSDDDVWGIKQSDMDFSDIANIKTLGGVYLGITPLKNMSLLSVSVAAGLAITAVLVGIFILLMIGGYGAANPNIEKGWKYLRGAQGKIIAVGGIFILALFMITIVFFSLYIFSKIEFAL